MVETYAEDMAKVIESDTGGLVKKIIQGEQKHELEKKNLSPQSRKNKIFMLISLFLMVIAVGILSYFFLKPDTNTVPVEKQFIPLIFNDQSTFLEIAGFTPEQIAQIVSNQISATQVKNGGVEGIYLTNNKQVVGFKEFVSLIKGNFDPGDNAQFISDNFLMGTVNAGTRGFFLLVKVRSTADVFDSMHAWENKMLSDLYGFLGMKLQSDNSYLFVKNFEDGVIENKNARVLYDNAGKIILMYVFADDNSVIITNSQSAMHEVVLRLASTKAK